MIDKEIKSNIIKKFGLKEDSPLPSESIDIKSFISFMKEEFSYEVDIHDKYALKQIYLKQELNIPSCITLKNFQIFLDDIQNNFNMTKKNSCLLFTEFKDITFISSRSKNDELAYSKKNTISAALAPIHKYIFRNNKNFFLEPFEHPIKGASIYKFNNFTAIKTGDAGNHRIYGCMLFAPLLEDVSIILEELTIYTPNKHFYQKIYYLEEIIKFFSIRNFTTKIEFKKATHYEVIQAGIYKVEVSLKVYSKNNDLVFEFINMDLEDIYKNCNAKLLSSIHMLNEIFEKKKKIRFYKMGKERYSLYEESSDGYTMDINMVYEKLFIKKLPLYKKIMFIFTKIFINIFLPYYKKIANN